jgi:hypothetical protein
MSKQFSLRGWRVEFDRRGLTITAPDQMSYRREIKTEAWLQAADAFVPGSLLLADVSLRTGRTGNARRLARTRVTGRRSL